LKGKRYRAQREDIAAVVNSLLEEPNVVFEDQQAVWSALSDFLSAPPVKTANGTKQANFADALITNKLAMIARNRRVEYEGTYTFDRAALAINGTGDPATRS